MTIIRWATDEVMAAVDMAEPFTKARPGYEASTPDEAVAIVRSNLARMHSPLAKDDAFWEMVVFTLREMTW